MRRWFHWMLSVWGILMMLLLSRSLIRGPEMLPETVYPDTTATRTAILCMHEPDNSADIQARTDASTDHRKLSDMVRDDSPNLSLSTDRNGFPILGRAWRTAVYMVFHPEGVPG